MLDGKDIKIQSLDPSDWEVVSGTIIDGGGLGSCVIFDQGEGSNSILEGFTLTNGGGTYVDYYYDYESIEGNAGGGIFCLDSSPTIRRCNIRANGVEEWPGATNVDYGGGIALIGDCQANIISCFITDNAAGQIGGGIVIRSDTPQQATSTIRNCTIVNNKTYAESYFAR